MGRENKMRRVLCNFCDCSRSRFELRPHEQDQEALTSMESELKRLRLLTRRMTGKDLHGLSFTELVLLESHLKDVLLIVQNQKKKVKMQEDERLRKQKKGAEDEYGVGRALSVSCTSSGSSSGDSPQKRDDEAPGMRLQREFERRNAESTQSEFERLFLLNERMNGRDLDGMTYFELFLLEGQILNGMNSVKVEKLEPRWEQMARQLKEESMSLLAEQETCSLDNENGKDDRHLDIALRFGLQHSRLSVSRKLRRFQNRYHRKNRPAMRSVCQTQSVFGQ